MVALGRGSGDEEGREVAVGAIIGAPFMLATIAMLLVTVSAYGYRNRPRRCGAERCVGRSLRRLRGVRSGRVGLVSRAPALAG